MMLIKPSPPPVAGLYPRRSASPMFVTPGSRTDSKSNCLVLAWPSLGDQTPPSAEHGIGDNRLLPIAEQKKTQASFVVTPSGQPVLKVQSSYQGFFAPSMHLSRTPNGGSMDGGSGQGAPPGYCRKHGRDEERSGSFISLSDSPPGLRKTSSWPVKCTKSTTPMPPQLRQFDSDDSRVRFRREKDGSLQTDEFGASSDQEGGSSYDVMPSTGDWSHNSERNKLLLRYNRRRVAHGQSHPCEMFCWLLMTAFVFLVLVCTIFFIYSDYQRSAMQATTRKCATLRQFLEERLIAQPIAVTEIANFFDKFLQSNDSQTGVMSFHGGGGVGKSFTSQLIADCYFSDPEMFSCVSTLSVPMYHSWQSEATRGRLGEWLAVKNAYCPFQLHVLDDLAGDTPCPIVSMIRDALSSLVAAAEPNVKHVVIITTDIASVRIHQIALYYLETNKQGGVDTYRFDQPIEQSWRAIDDFHARASEELEDDGPNSCHFQSLSELLNVSVPFLPLERQNVERCVLDNAEEKGLVLSDSQVKWVTDQLVYVPKHWPVFSSSGCKLVSEKVNIIHSLGEV